MSVEETPIIVLTRILTSKLGLKGPSRAAIETLIGESLLTTPKISDATTATRKRSEHILMRHVATTLAPHVPNQVRIPQTELSKEEGLFVAIREIHTTIGSMYQHLAEEELRRLSVFNKVQSEAVEKTAITRTLRADWDNMVHDLDQLNEIAEISAYTGIYVLPDEDDIFDQKFLFASKRASKLRIVKTPSPLAETAPATYTDRKDHIRRSINQVVTYIRRFLLEKTALYQKLNRKWNTSFKETRAAVITTLAKREPTPSVERSRLIVHSKSA